MDTVIWKVEPYTAWILASDWWWMEEYRFRVKGGTTEYTDATISRTGKRVKLQYITSELKVVTRYVHPDTLIEFVSIN